MKSGSLSYSLESGAGSIIEGVDFSGGIVLSIPEGVAFPDGIILSIPEGVDFRDGLSLLISEPVVLSGSGVFGRKPVSCKGSFSCFETFFWELF